MADATLFRRAVDVIHPGARGRDLLQLLDGKAKRTTVLTWYAGRRHAPQWALDILAAKARDKAATPLAIERELRSAPPRPGKQAGAINLARYRTKHG